MIGAAIGAAAGIGTAIYGGIKAKKEQKKLDELVKNRPKYAISSEYSANKGIADQQREYAQNNLRGQDTVATMANNESDITASNSMQTAQQSSNSSGGILSALASINTATNNAKRGNAMDAASRLTQKQSLAQSADSNMAGANTAMAEEKDKEWNFNTNEPYQDKVAAGRDKVKDMKNLQNQGINMAMSQIPGVAGGIGKKKA